MMVDQSALFLVANLILFACCLLYWLSLLQPNWVTGNMLLGSVLLFLSWQALALLWSTVRLQPGALVTTYLSSMLLAETTVLIYLFLERLLTQKAIGAFVLTVAFVIHAYVTILIPVPLQESTYVSPFLRSPWYLLHLLTTLVAYGACTCAGGGGIAYFVSRHLSRGRLAPRMASWQDCQAFTRRALTMGFPWLSASLLIGAFWAQSAWGSYWAWRPDEVWLLVVWLILVIALHARTLPPWRGRPLAILSLLALASALISLPLLGQGSGPG